MLYFNYCSLFRYEVNYYTKIEQLIDKKLPLFETEKAEVELLMDRVEEAKRMGRMVSDN